jgi:epoxyqueuosine reductase
MRESMLSDQIRELAKNQGIDILRITHAKPFEGYRLSDSPRRDPHLIVPNARSLIICGIYIGGFTLPDWEDSMMGRTSRLFLSGFFLDVVGPLRPIVDLLLDQGFSAWPCDGFESGGSVLPLKLAAVRAGMGWQGKHTLLISQDYGTFMALGGVVTDAPFQSGSHTVKDRCGTCQACQQACPTGALDEPYRLKRERCLSHLIQEETLAPEVYRLMGNRIVDCEICQTACPWNKKHIKKPMATMRTRQFQERMDSLTKLFKLPNLVKLSAREYKDLNGPLRTDIPYTIFRRNVVAALGQSEQPSAIPLLQIVLEDSDPHVRKMAEISIKALQDREP